MTTAEQDWERLMAEPPVIARPPSPTAVGRQAGVAVHPAATPAEIYPGLPDADYFAIDALSHSDTKLLDPPARYRWVKDHGRRDYNPAYEFGHVVHELVLGTGGGIEIIDASDWRTKAAKEQRDEALAAGRAPMLVDEYQRAKTCADAVRTHPIADRLLASMDHAELAMTWDDSGVLRKAKLDCIAGRFGVDLKTTQDASTDAFGRSAGKFGYATQDAWYRDALRACMGIEDPQFLFLVVEANPPHFVNVVQLDTYDVELGARRNQERIDLFRRCRDADDWPAYGDGINTATLPRWAEIELEAA